MEVIAIMALLVAYMWIADNEKTTQEKLAEVKKDESKSNKSTEESA